MQRIVVFQPRGSGEEKIRAIEEHGRDVALERVNIDEALPPVIDDPEPYLPSSIEADLVLGLAVRGDLRARQPPAALSGAEGPPAARSSSLAMGMGYRRVGAHS